MSHASGVIIANRDRQIGMKSNSKPKHKQLNMNTNSCYFVLQNCKLIWIFFLLFLPFCKNFFFFSRFFQHFSSLTP
jgi:hypothetical protein